ncbi:hypothetical protein ACFFQW_44525 [Umezawaea endophytica]|uniref:Uncharacterized protein n=1 Tax=Umezawaea endophytica TaxID=1654476 RepID=A0A9X2VYP8_9PSEU|nr:hypothetical protein [Umezawaea endophytica]MCS7484842.1 hypothetical protein [Umezawaea endophytica]
MNDSGERWFTSFQRHKTPSAPAPELHDSAPVDEPEAPAAPDSGLADQAPSSDQAPSTPDPSSPSTAARQDAPVAANAAEEHGEVHNPASDAEQSAVTADEVASAADDEIHSSGSESGDTARTVPVFTVSRDDARTATGNETPAVTTSMTFATVAEGANIIGAQFNNTMIGHVPLSDSPARPAHLQEVLNCYAEPAGATDLLTRVQAGDPIVVFDLGEGQGRTTHAEALAARLLGFIPRKPDIVAANHAIRTDDIGQSGHVGPRQSGDPASAHTDPGASSLAMPSAVVPPLVVPFPASREFASTMVDAARLRFTGVDHFPHERLPLNRGRVWFLQLPADEDEYKVADDFSHCLPELRRRLTAQGSALFVLTRPSQWRRIGGNDHTLYVQASTVVQVPTLRQVAQARVTGRLPSVDTGWWFDHTAVTERINSAGTAQAAAVADSIVTAELTPVELLPVLRFGSAPTKPASADGTGTDETESIRSRRLAMVLSAGDHWQNELLAWHCLPGRTAFERAFQLTAAAMTGLPAAHVYLGAVELTRQLDSKAASDDIARSAPGVIQMLHAIEGRQDDGDRIRFRRSGWEDAILEYFWADRPLARENFITWLPSAPLFQAKAAMETVTDAQRRAVARRVVRFALRWAHRQDRDIPLKTLAQAWRTDRPALWAELVSILDAVACADDTDEVELGEEIASVASHRGFVHQLLLNWSKTQQVGLRHVVLEICAGTFAERYTGKALVRLKYAGAHADEHTLSTLTRAIERLWQEPSARPVLIAEVASWCVNDATVRAGCVAFAHLAALRIPVAAGPDSTQTQTPDTPAPNTQPSDLWPPLEHDLTSRQPTGVPVEHRTPDMDSVTAQGSISASHGSGVLILEPDLDYVPDETILSRCWRVLLHTEKRFTGEQITLITSWLDAALSAPPQRPTILSILRKAVRGDTADDRHIRDGLRGAVRAWSGEAPECEALYQELTRGLDADLARPIESALTTADSSRHRAVPAQHDDTDALHATSTTPSTPPATTIALPPTASPPTAPTITAPMES